MLHFTNFTFHSLLKNILCATVASVLSPRGNPSNDICKQTFNV